MKQFLKKHIQQALAVVAFVFLGIIAAYYIWGIMTISLYASQAINPASQGSGSTAFNLSGAKNLNLKGLMQK